MAKKRKVKPELVYSATPEVVQPTQYDRNKAKFEGLKYHWQTVKVGFLRSLEGGTKLEFERIYREELNPKWNPNVMCKSCYFDAIKQMIEYFKL